MPHGRHLFIPTRGPGRSTPQAAAGTVFAARGADGAWSLRWIAEMLGMGHYTRVAQTGLPRHSKATAGEPHEPETGKKLEELNQRLLETEGTT
jgi:hypothetical protein